MTTPIILALIFFSINVAAIIVIGNLLCDRDELRDKVEKQQMEIDMLRRRSKEIIVTPEEMEKYAKLFGKDNGRLTNGMLTYNTIE